MVSIGSCLEIKRPYKLLHSRRQFGEGLRRILCLQSAARRLFGGIRHRRDVSRNFGRAARCFVNVTPDLICRRRLLLDRRCDRI